MRSRRVASWSVVVLGACVAVGTIGAAWAEPGRRARGPASARPNAIVRGMEGQRHLRLDFGRSLRLHPLLGRRARSDAREPRRLRGVERARLDARRVMIAARALDRDTRLERLVAIVRRHLPFRADGDAAYLDVSRQASRRGVVKLSDYIRERSGTCRERSFLLAGMLREAGIEVVVKYGLLYHRVEGYVGGHAWVEARVDGEWLLLDVSMQRAVRPRHLTTITESLPDGRVRTVRGRETEELLYVPTRDLRRL